MYGVEFSLIDDHHEAEENQNFGEDFHEDLGDEEDDVQSWERLVFVLIPWSQLFTQRWQMILLPDVEVGIRDGEKWEQDGHRAPVDNFPQVAEIIKSFITKGRYH